MADLYLARRKISDVLASKEKEYWELMKRWYRGRVRRTDKLYRHGDSTYLLKHFDFLLNYYTFLFTLCVYCIEV